MFQRQVYSMYRIKDITVLEYFKQGYNPEYDIFFGTLQPENLFCGKRCITKNLTFNEVEVMKRIFYKPSYEDLKDMFLMCFNIRGTMQLSAEQMFLQESVFQFFRAHRFLSDFIQDIDTKERKLLTGKPDEKWLRVNAPNRLQPVNHLLTRIRLAEQFSTTPKEVGSWKYNEVFAILVANNRYAGVMSDYNEIK